MTLDSKPPLPALAASVAGLVILSFVGGAYLAWSGTPPFYLLRDGFQAARTFSKVLTGSGKAVHTNLWQRRERTSTGVVHKAPSEMQPGYTFYTSGAFQGANLVDADGEVVHQWRAPFREVWSSRDHVAQMVPPDQIYWRDAHPYPDGDVLALYIGSGSSPWGYGLARLDADSDVVWTFDDKAHHDVDLAADGDVYTLVHNFRDLRERPIEGYPNLDKTILEDFVVELGPNGEEKNRFSLLESVARSHYSSWVRNTFHNENWDLLHTNTVESVSRRFASHHRAIEAGDVLVSFRRQDMLAILDPSSGDLQWAARGRWVAQHDPDALPNGNVLLFDNRGANSERENLRSRVLEFSFGPDHRRFDWTYSGTNENPLRSWIRAVQQKLPNGNVLITESNGGRLLEVTPGGDVAWELHSAPVKETGGNRYIPVLSSGRRVPRSYADF